ncbi:MAG: hypothetical protein AUK55_03380 [Syntrophobacteraceae bacterium CG2_30_61_12]|nr:MAG: hypothetical protein AUK55_03380 [Syntrophobacteraceae bacterium CG2_30_61_12]PIU32160.1 MAG: hypothetical protein COT06_04220 [Syntrophobacteraceae bacterium CG07_land_8_20_14_0_80_61_8]
MFQITPHMRILAAVEPVDFRKDIDSLAQFSAIVSREQAARLRQLKQNIVGAAFDQRKFMHFPNAAFTGQESLPGIPR